MLKRLGVAVAVSVAMGQAGAALHDRGGGMIYDDVLNVTWLANANYAATELTDTRRDAIIANVGTVAGHTLEASDFHKAGASYTGLMTWWGAMAWAQDLVFGGFSDWRLPTTLQPDTSCSSSLDAGAPHGIQSYGFGCTGSELGHHFYNNLGGNAGESVSDQTGDSPQEIANLGLFRDVQFHVYWSGTEDAPDTDNAWNFRTNVGLQLNHFKGNEFFAWAVRPGDVARVPEPGTLALLGLGLGLFGLGYARGRG